MRKLTTRIGNDWYIDWGNAWHKFRGVAGFIATITLIGGYFNWAEGDGTDGVMNMLIYGALLMISLFIFFCVVGFVIGAIGWLFKQIFKKLAKPE
jgi:hypothetical protein